MVRTTRTLRRKVTENARWSRGTPKLVHRDGVGVSRADRDEDGAGQFHVVSSRRRVRATGRPAERGQTPEWRFPVSSARMWSG